MVAVLIGCAVVWAIVTGMTGGNWAAGLAVALVVLGMCTSGMRAVARQRAEDEGEFVLVRREPERKGWF
jgi:Zn-dependent alcohol dehydrogenase